MKIYHFLRTTMVAFLLSVFVLGASAQSTLTVTGSVTDDSGVPVSVVMQGKIVEK